MLEDLRQKIRSIRQDYDRDLDRLIGDLQHGRISGNQYREQASMRRTKFFEEDNAAHAEMSERVNRKYTGDVPTLSGRPPLKE